MARRTLPFSALTFSHASPEAGRRGLVISVGRKPVAVAYEFSTGASSGSIATAASQAKCDALRAMWLEPTVILRLEDGRHIDIAITQCEASKATFEIVDDG
ncbi:hypothetical protein MKK84_05790 [Methylobacterium sp. E-065]|uniref:hypothetical protein n=1 Tax=Methylobacterium sp. E-065 TaxID=2836583 RepID=UPI001FBB9FC8|nr:hypothetical protein [Methylobacterium sp. E-065]MCJ2016940.1 hypothetical protein [Methylobacterium sp. E-065]